jgi:hypothetical protein
MFDKLLDYSLTGLPVFTPCMQMRHIACRCASFQPPPYRSALDGAALIILSGLRFATIESDICSPLRVLVLHFLKRIAITYWTILVTPNSPQLHLLTLQIS